MKNERKTENVVRDALRALGYYDEDNDVLVEEQKSVIDAVKRLLKSASKSGKGGKGAPEFIISSPREPDFLLTIECKASTQDHASKVAFASPFGMQPNETEETYTRRVQRFGVDGGLRYASKLSRKFNVISVAVSGETVKQQVISVHLHAKGTDQPHPLRTKQGNDIEELLAWDDLIEYATFDPGVQRLRFHELMTFAKDLHEFMRDHAKLTESEKPLLVSGTLIALRNKAFALSYEAHTPEDLQKEWMRVIRTESNCSPLMR